MQPGSTNTVSGIWATEAAQQLFELRVMQWRLDQVLIPAFESLIAPLMKIDTPQIPYQ